MCGICGIYQPDGVDLSDLKAMLAALVHRGPDDTGTYLDGRIGMGSQRLSIIDLQGGHQPVCNEDKSIWVVYNGEIYNYMFLRQQLQKKGHRFHTGTDTEVLVHLYEEMGADCVLPLQGMFAFAIWDTRNQRLFLARDRMGQKPLFYARIGQHFFFASEIKALLATKRVPVEPDYESMHHYLSLRFVPSPGTMLRHVSKLPPGHTMAYENNRLTIERYWTLSFRSKTTQKEAALLPALHDKMSDAINSHMVGDVPVGAFLSGGMDSSMIVAMMAKEMNQSIQTFAIGVQESSFNELPYARMVAEQYRTLHTEHYIASDIIRSLPALIWHLDEPSDPIAACQFHAAELAARHVKVVLGGDGGDELFAGFDRYLGVRRIENFRLVPGFIREWALAKIIAGMSDGFGYKNLTQKMRWLHQLSLLPDIARRYAAATCFFRFTHLEKQALFHRDLWLRLRELDSSDIIIEHFESENAEDPIDRMLFADFMTRLPEHSLMLTDRMSMAHGLETRSPFLDHRLVEFVASFPSNLKIRGGKLKYILRKLAADYLPKKIIERPKQGFMFPVAHWFRNDLHYLLQRFFSDAHLERDGIINTYHIQRYLQEHRHNQVDHHVRLWMLLNLEIWYRMYIENVAKAEIEAELHDHQKTIPAQAPDLSF